MDHKQYSPEDRLQIGRMIMLLLDQWEVDPGDRIRLLGLPETTKKRALERFRHETPLPNDEKLFLRIEHLTAIYESLLTTFPHNHSMGKIWMHTRNRRFRRQTPLQWMVSEEMVGIKQVLGHLDCTTQWY